MQNTLRTQVKRITVAVIAVTAIAGGVQIAGESPVATANSVTANATTPEAPAAAPTPTPSSSKNGEEWG
ncbi:hypothetical protein [Streptomyces sp. NPDC059564]|uniref:hypothetical protein n=1 Tax=Streptomyces sp. NPDC059564 TaxID=3346865 RepID=UPI0036C2DF06